MSLNAMTEMRQSNSLIARITASAAQLDAPTEPAMWVQMNLWNLVKCPEWATRWDEVKAALDVNQEKDLGIRTDVISDAMIGTAVAALINPTPTGGEPESEPAT
jgi:hypothetical protein